MSMMGENDWVRGIAPRLKEGLWQSADAYKNVDVRPHHKLAYAMEATSYIGMEPELNFSLYETDLLIVDKRPDDSWTPLVVIECKLGSVTTHDALTYSAKSATHKQVHPYLRYGILISALKGGGVPRRLFRHGSSFDFMLAWQTADSDAKEWADLMAVLIEEIDSSRLIHKLLTESKTSDRGKYSVVHRPLKMV